MASDFAYKVQLKEAALNDYRRIISDIMELTLFPLSAEKWANKIMQKAQSLRIMPEGSPTFHTNPNYRFAMVGKYMIIFRVDKTKKLVIIERIFYARANLNKLELGH